MYKQFKLFGRPVREPGRFTDYTVEKCPLNSISCWLTADRTASNSCFELEFKPFWFAYV